MKLNRSRSIELATVEVEGCLDKSRGSLMGSTPQPEVDQAESENGDATWFRSRNQIRLFGTLTYMHIFAYQDWHLGMC